VALHLAQQRADRVERAVALNPPPPTGFGADEAMIAASQSLALADDAAWPRRRATSSQQSSASKIW